MEGQSITVYKVGTGTVIVLQVWLIKAKGFRNLQFDCQRRQNPVSLLTDESQVLDSIQYFPSKCIAHVLNEEIFYTLKIYWMIIWKVTYKLSLVTRANSVTNKILFGGLCGVFLSSSNFYFLGNTLLLAFWDWK